MSVGSGGSPSQPDAEARYDGEQLVGNFRISRRRTTGLYSRPQPLIPGYSGADVDNRLVYFHGITTKNGQPLGLRGEARGNSFVIDAVTEKPLVEIQPDSFDAVHFGTAGRLGSLALLSHGMPYAKFMYAI